jgi:Iron-sulfur cluster assembly protein
VAGRVETKEWDHVARCFAQARLGNKAAAGTHSRSRLHSPPPATPEIEKDEAVDNCQLPAVEQWEETPWRMRHEIGDRHFAREDKGHDVACDFLVDYDGAAVLEALARVLDPELDESIVDLGFVRSLRLHSGHADVAPQQPTSWCAVNFAYLMAEDMRRALLTVEGVR